MGLSRLTSAWSSKFPRSTMPSWYTVTHLAWFAIIEWITPRSMAYLHRPANGSRYSCSIHFAHILKPVSLLVVQYVSVIHFDSLFCKILDTHVLMLFLYWRYTFLDNSLVHTEYLGIIHLLKANPSQSVASFLTTWWSKTYSLLDDFALRHNKVADFNNTVTSFLTH